MSAMSIRGSFSGTKSPMALIYARFTVMCYLGFSFWNLNTSELEQWSSPDKIGTEDPSLDST